MLKNYPGFCIRTIEEEIGVFFKRNRQREVFSKINVSAETFAEAQQLVCDKMQNHNMYVAFVFPYPIKKQEKEEEKE